LIDYEHPVYHKHILFTTSARRDENDPGQFKGGQSKRLDPESSESVTCTFPNQQTEAAGLKFVSAKILVVTRYHLMKVLTPKHYNRHRFSTVQDEHGNYSWTEQSLRDTQW